jgi:lipopolysaccharide assembly protein A
MKFFTTVLLFIVILIGVSFACLNAEPVSVDYYYKTAEVPLSLLLAMVLALGGVLGMAVSFFMLIRLKAKNLALQCQLKSIEKTVENAKKHSVEG